jgi:hypothetical protein
MAPFQVDEFGDGRDRSCGDRRPMLPMTFFRGELLGPPGGDRDPIA